MIVRMDESYANTNIHSNFGWFDPNTPEKNRLGAKAGKGHRLIMMHTLDWEGLGLKILRGGIDFNKF